MDDFGTEKYSASSSITASFALPSRASAVTETEYSPSEIFLTLDFLACGLTATRILSGMKVAKLRR